MIPRQPTMDAPPPRDTIAAGVCSPEQHDSPCVRGCVESLDRCESVLATIASTDRPEVVERIGPHVRHIIDHFTCMLDGLAQRVVNYDARAREARLERNLDAMRLALHEVSSRVVRLRPIDLSREISIEQRVCSDATSRMRSSVDRELAFLSAHTVHHLSIVAQILRAHDVSIDPSLELAFSTAEYQQTKATQRSSAS